MRVLAIKNGIILSASIQSGFQIFQERMTRKSINKYQPSDLKFKFITLRIPRQVYLTLPVKRFCLKIKKNRPCLGKVF